MKLRFALIKKKKKKTPYSSLYDEESMREDAA